jgi:hypothetical protein
MPFRARSCSSGVPPWLSLRVEDDDGLREVQGGGREVLAVLALGGEALGRGLLRGAEERVGDHGRVGHGLPAGEDRRVRLHRDHAHVA